MASESKRSAPQSFFLYGEPVKTADPDFVHIENLAIRSKPSQWSIAPHLHEDLNHLILISGGGGGQIRFESETTTFRAPSLLVVPARVVHGFDWEAESEGMVMTLADVYLLQSIRRYPELAGLFAQPRAIGLAEPECSRLSTAMGVIARELSWSGVGQSAAIEGALLLVLVHATRRLQHIDQIRPQPHKQLGLVARYRQLIEDRFWLREPISTYARELGVSLTTLREACASTGQSPTELRDQRTILEAQRMLAYSLESVASIGAAVGIPDPAYFSRFFSRKCGLSPDAWRRSLDKTKGRAAS